MQDERREEGSSEFLTAKQAGTLLGLSSGWTIYALKREGKLRAYTIAGRNSLRFKRADVLALMQPTEHVKREDRRRPESAEV